MACGVGSNPYRLWNVSTKAFVFAFHFTLGSPTFSEARPIPASRTFFQNVGSRAGPPQLWMAVRAVGANPRLLAWLTTVYAAEPENSVSSMSYGGVWLLNRRIWAVK